jgi:ATP-dependent Clp protease ATP-binding subunit ClpA
VLFSPLTHDEVREIARHYLHQVALALAKAGKTIGVDDEALEVLVAKGYNIAFGARFLKRFIDEHIKLPISAHWKDGSHFDVKVKDGELVVESGIATAESAARALAFGDVA